MQISSRIISLAQFGRLHLASIASKRFASTSPKVLITGGHGQLGGSMADVLRKRFGPDNVLLTDIVKPNQIITKGGQYAYVDIMDRDSVNKTIVDFQADWVIHFSALLSAIAEFNVEKALDINVTGLINILQATTKHRCRLFIPSTIGAFGPNSPLDFTPNDCIQQPNTVYGVTKVFAERLGEYFNTRYGLDFRSLRLPGILSTDSLPGGGTTDYAVDVFHKLLKTGQYECYLEPNAILPMMYIDDCTRAILEFMQVPADQVKRRVYNISAVSFGPEELFDEIKKLMPNAKFSYKPDSRQAIAASWPKVLDDSLARSEWNWKHEYGTKELVDVMLKGISKSIHLL